MVVDLIGFGIVVPVLPFYAHAYGASATTLGLLLMVYAAAQFVCAPLWGRLSDRIGRRPVLLLTVTGTAVSLLLLGSAGSLLGLFLARALGGAFAANISVATAYVSDVTAEEERTRYMGLIGASFGVGFVVGPAVGGLLAPLGYAVPMLAAAGLAGVNAVHAFFALEEPERRATPEEPAAGPPTSGAAAALQDPRVRRLCLANLGFSLAVTQLETIFAFFMLDRFGYDAWEVAWILVLMAVVMGGIQGGGMKRLAAAFRERSLVVTGSLLLGLCFLAVPTLHSLPWLLLVLTASAASRAIVQPPLMSLASVVAPADQRGRVLGVFQSAGSLARVVGPVTAGLLYDAWVPGPFVLAAGLLAAVAWVARRLPLAATSPAPGPSGTIDPTWTSSTSPRSTPR